MFSELCVNEENIRLEVVNELRIIRLTIFCESIKMYWTATFSRPPKTQNHVTRKRAGDVCSQMTQVFIQCSRQVLQNIATFLRQFAS